MRRHRTSVLLFSTLVGVLALHLSGVTRAADTQVVQKDGGKHANRCSVMALRGTYAASLSGWVGAGADRAPYSEVGLIRLDGKGGLVATTTFSLDGVIGTHEYIGTYTVDAETCTGEALTNLGNFVFVVGDNVNQTRFIATTPGFTIDGEAIRQ